MIVVFTGWKINHGLIFDGDKWWLNYMRESRYPVIKAIHTRFSRLSMGTYLLIFAIDTKRFGYWCMRRAPRAEQTHSGGNWNSPWRMAPINGGMSGICRALAAPLSPACRKPAACLQHRWRPRSHVFFYKIKMRWTRRHLMLPVSSTPIRDNMLQYHMTHCTALNRLKLYCNYILLTTVSLEEITRDFINSD